MNPRWIMTPAERRRNLEKRRQRAIKATVSSPRKAPVVGLTQEECLYLQNMLKKINEIWHQSMLKVLCMDPTPIITLRGMRCDRVSEMAKLKSNSS